MGRKMILIFVLVASFGTALAIGYLAIVADQGIKAVAESKVGGKFGRWLFLFPVLDFLDHFLSEMAPEIIRRIAGVVGFALLAGAIFAAIWFLGAAVFSALLFIFAFLLRHFVWVAFISAAIATAVYFTRRL